MKRLLLLAPLIAVVGCERIPSVPEDLIPAIVMTADTLLQTQEIGDVAQSEWPYVISEFLRPESVRVHADGLFIVTSQYFVDEAGVFISRDPNWSDADPGEPHFTQLAPRVFEYHAPG